MWPMKEKDKEKESNGNQRNSNGNTGVVPSSPSYFEMESETQPLRPNSISLEEEEDSRNKKSDPAMDLIQAAKDLEPEKLHSILQQGVNPNGQDEQGRTALHWIMCFDCHCTTCMENVETCLYVLFMNPGTDADIEDKDGVTALHLAAENQLDKCSKLLIYHGADMYKFTHAGDQALKIIAKKQPDVYLWLLDRAIYLDGREPSSEKCTVKIDFSAVVGQTEQMLEHRQIMKLEMCTSRKSHCHNKSHISCKRWRNENELSLLRSLLTSNKYSRQRIFSHPAVAIFLDQKWRRVSKQFFATFIAYIFWLLIYTSYVLYIYLIKCPCKFYNATMKHGRTLYALDENDEENLTRSGDIRYTVNDAEKACLEATQFHPGILLLFGLTIIMTLNEVVKIFITPKLYFKSRLNTLHWILIILVVVTFYPTFARQRSISEEQYQVAAVTIFLAWSLILSQIAKFPKVGQHMDIFGHVLKQFWSFLLTYVSLFIAFALAFSILFPGDRPYTIFPFAFLKIFVMMVGEMEYNDMFYNAENDQASGPFVGHILYATFVIVVAIVLMNLLIGLTVSDIKSLQKEAELSRVCRQIIDMFHLESFLFSDKIPGFIKKTCQKMTSVVETPPETSRKETPISSHASSRINHEEPVIQSKYRFTFYPNDSNDTSVPEKLKARALELAVKIQTEKKGKACAKKKCFLLSKIGIKKDPPDVPSPSEQPLVTNF